MTSAYRVAIVGASSLLGAELARLLSERRFPIAQLYTAPSGTEAEDLPVLDVASPFPVTLLAEDVGESEVDFAFVTAPLGRQVPGFLRPASDQSRSRCVSVDLIEGGAGSVLSVPLFERAGWLAVPDAGAKRYASAHPATLMIATLLHRLTGRLAWEGATAQVFASASEVGAKAIEELQTQTVNLLSFQKIPQAVFGAQLAFNMLPRLGRAHTNVLRDLGSRIGGELRTCLGTSIPLPALRVFQVPVFYSLALSLYVELAKPASPEAVAKALAGERIHVRRASDHVPSQAETTGGNDIEVGAIVPDEGRPEGIWIWATADNIRLAALNAVEIAEQVIGKTKSPRVH